MITRRQMLARLLGGSVALAAADIWIPGERSIFLPERSVRIADFVNVTVGPLIAGGPPHDLTRTFTLMITGVFAEPQIITGYDTAVSFYTDAT